MPPENYSNWMKITAHRYKKLDEQKSKGFTL